MNGTAVSAAFSQPTHTPQGVGGRFSLAAVNMPFVDALAV